MVNLSIAQLIEFLEDTDDFGVERAISLKKR